MSNAAASRFDRGTCPRLIAAWTGAACRRRLWVLLAAAVLTLAALVAIGTRLGISTNTVDMLSPELPFREQAKALNAAFPERQDQIVAVVDAPTPERADEAVTALQRRLEGAPHLTGLYRPDDAFLRTHALYYLSPERLGQLMDRLAGAQPLLATLSEQPNLRGLAEVLDLATRAGAASPADGLAPLLDEMAASAEALAEGAARNLSWQALLPDRPGGAATQRALILQPELDYSRLKPAGAAIDEVQAAAEAVDAETPARVRLTGEAVIKHQELETVEDSAALSGLLSLLGVSVILAFGLRWIRLVAASLLTLVIGLIWTAGLAALVVGELNLISVAFAVLFVGLGIDFAIHFVLRVREAGSQRIAAVARGGAGCGCAILLGALCTAIGFLAFWPTDYRGLAELGLIAGLGMFVAAFASLTLLPAFLGLLGWPERKPRAGTARDVTTWAIRRRKRTLTALAALALAALVVAPGVRFDFNPMGLRDPDSVPMQLFDELARDPATTPYVIEALADDLAGAQQLAARFRADPAFGQVRTLASYVPDQQERKAAILADAGFFLGPVLAGAVHPGGLDGAARRAAFGDLRRAAGELAGRDDAFGRSAGRLAAALERIGPGQAAALEARWTAYLPDFFRQLEAAVAADPFGRDDLPQDLARRWVSADGRARVEARPAQAVVSNGEIRAFAAAARAVTPQATGVPITIDAAARVVVDAFILATAIAALGMLMVLTLALRRLTDVLLALAPLPLAGVWTLATAALAGVTLNFANIIVLPLLMGLTVASGIHLVLRWRQEGSAANTLSSSTPRAVMLSVLTTLAAFGSLAVADHPGMSSMGTLLTIAVVYVVLSVLVALPALAAALGRNGSAA